MQCGNPGSVTHDALAYRVTRFSAVAGLWHSIFIFSGIDAAASLKLGLRSLGRGDLLRHVPRFRRRLIEACSQEDTFLLFAD